MALEMSAESEPRTHIAALLQRASEAHAQYEGVILKHPDPNWPRWLAGFTLDRGLNRLIQMSINEDQLARLLQQYEQDYVARGMDGSHSEYYAQRLLEDAR